MFRQLNDFQEAYRAHAQGVERLMAVLTDENLSQRVAPGHRTLGEIAWHVVATIPEMMARTGLKLGSIDPETPPPASAALIQEGYQQATGELLAALEAQWSDATLAQVDEMYGESWSRGLTLAILLHHEIHHLGQMTVLLRQAGAVVPGLFGPAKEEWTRYGMDEPPY